MDDAKTKRAALVGFLATLFTAFVAAAGIGQAEGASSLVVWLSIGVSILILIALLYLQVLDVIAAYPFALRVAIVAASVVLAAALGWLVGSALSSPQTTGSPPFARRLSTIFRRLDTSRAHAYQRLKAADKPATQAEIATGLAQKFSPSAVTLRRLPVGAADRRTRRALALRIEAISGAYASLAAAATARDGSQQRLDWARARIQRAGHRLTVAECSLSDDGYVVEFITPHSNRD